MLNEARAGARRRGVAVVLNPRSVAGPVAPWWPQVMERLRGFVDVGNEIETCSDGGTRERVAQLVRDSQPEIVVAAGGDGTVSEVVDGMLSAGAAVPPALAIIPLGTANDVARDLGLLSLRRYGAAAADRAVSAILDGIERRIDLGQLGARYFVGSFAVGMDADILRSRNRMQQRWHMGRRLGGYPLYLWSCALNTLRRHGGEARLQVDGQERSVRVYNLLVTNTALYAGEFRFDADNAADDGRLDLHLFTGAMDYLCRFPAAWRRHVRYERGLPVRPPRALQRVRAVQIELAAPVASQLDGEECAAAASFSLRVVPRALVVRVPRVGAS